MTDFEIVNREDFSEVTYMLEIAHPAMAKAARPGQFVIVMEHAHGERIPLTIADFDRKRGTITLVIQAVGKTTREMQQSCRVGTRLHAVVGPMGIPSHIGKAKKVSTMSHAWLIWQGPDGWLILDATNFSRPLNPERVSKSEFLPIYSYAPGGKYTHAMAGPAAGAKYGDHL